MEELHKNISTIIKKFKNSGKISLHPNNFLYFNKCPLASGIYEILNTIRKKSAL